MSFTRIPGQDKTKKHLQDSIKKERISHAYLFTGSRGLGKLELAIEFAKTIFCKESNTDSCDQCISCRKIEHKNHPDLNIIDVKEGHKMILIDQIRDLQKEINYKPYESEYKVYIINQADKLTEQAQNSLLKTLEEPPEYAVIILICEETNQLRPTIVSRSQLVRLHNQPKEVITNYLSKETELNDQDLKLFTVLAKGRYKKALNLVTKDDFIKNREDIINFILEIEDKDTFEIFNFTERLTELSKTDFPLFELILSLFRDLLIIKEKEKEENLINFDYREILKENRNKYKTDSIYKLTSDINKYKDYLNKNIKKDLLFPSLLFKIRNKKEL